MCPRFIPALALALGIALLHTPSPTFGGQADQDQIDRLIRQLGNKQFREREAATEALDALGEAALTALRKACTHEDAEIVRQAQGLVARIGHRAENARLLAPQRVRLAYQDRSVLEALSDAAKKTGLSLEFEGDRARLAQRTVTLDTGDVPVWEALERFVHAAGLAERAAPAAAKGTSKLWEVQNGAAIQGRLMISSGYLDTRSLHDLRMVFVDGKPEQWPAQLAGAVRLRAVPAAFAGPPAKPAPGEALFHLEVTPQPHMAWQSVLDIRIHRAVDEHGQVLTQAAGAPSSVNAANLLWARNGAVFVADLDYLGPSLSNRIHSLRLTHGKKPATVLKEVHGTVAAQTEVGPEPLITVDNIFHAAGRTFTAADGTILKLVGAAREDKDKIKVQVELQAPPVMQAAGVVVGRARRAVAGAAGNAREVEVSGLPLMLLDAAGQQVPLVSIESPQRVNEFGRPQPLMLTYQPRAGQDQAAKLVYAGRRTVVLDIPFTLKDVLLP